MGLCAGKGYVSTINAIVLDNGTLDDIYQEEAPLMHRRMKLVYQEAMLDPLSLTCINLSFTRLETAGCYHLAKLLSFSTNLRVLQLWKCQLGRKGAEFLILDLGSLQALEVLGLEDNRLGLEGTLILAPVIGTLSNLRELYYHINDLETSGSLALSRSVTSLTALAVFTLDENRIADAGLAQLLVALPLRKLEFLGLAHNAISDAGALGLAARANELLSLSRLSLNGNSLSSNARATLRGALPTVQFV